ncbi:MAG: CapA family protein [Chloroflexota bacterium]|nr:CapA family protein [Chloroflexota bacterium]
MNLTHSQPRFVLMLAAAMAVAACASPAGAPEAVGSITATSVAMQMATLTPEPTAGVSTVIPADGSPPASASPVPLVTANSITISAVGDISLARQVVERMQASGADYPYALVAPLIDGDIGFANLEGALTDRGDPWPKGYNFRTPPVFAVGLARAHFGVVTIANNHTMDFGTIGLTDTVEALDASGVRHAGAGANALAAHIPAVIEVKGLRVAFLGYAATPDESGGFTIRAWSAGEATPGITIGTPEGIAADVRAAKRIADFVIVAVHAGNEYITTPNDTQRSLAAAALAAGADAYIGAHAHVVQPVELRRNQLIAWGLGNFIFDLDTVDLANIPRPRVSVILDLTLTKGAGVTAYHAIPVTQDEEQDRPRPATPEEAAILQSLIGSPGQSAGP